MPHDTTVSILIDNENKWKTYFIQQMFQKEDADAILSISLPTRRRKNEVIWHYDRKGKYSVKSGYQVALKYEIPRFTKMV